MGWFFVINYFRKILRYFIKRQNEKNNTTKHVEKGDTHTMYFEVKLMIAAKYKGDGGGGVPYMMFFSIFLYSLITFPLGEARQRGAQRINNALLNSILVFSHSSFAAWKYYKIYALPGARV